MLRASDSLHTDGDASKRKLHFLLSNPLQLNSNTISHWAIKINKDFCNNNFKLDYQF